MLPGFTCFPGKRFIFPSLFQNTDSDWPSVQSRVFGWSTGTTWSTEEMSDLSCRILTSNWDLRVIMLNSSLQNTFVPELLRTDMKQILIIGLCSVAEPSYTWCSVTLSLFWKMSCTKVEPLSSTSHFIAMTYRSPSLRICILISMTRLMLANQRG